MVKIPIEKAGRRFECEECGLGYEEKEWAEKCEAWCKEHKSCNIEITSHAAKKI